MTTKCAVALSGALIVIVVLAEVGLATVPGLEVQFVKPYPAAAVAEIGALLPALKKVGLAGVTVPPAGGLAVTVNRYCVVKLAV